ncbi:MAG: LL-diaminopimelate aminotransferase [Simkaniaceae bacterium]
MTLLNPNFFKIKREYIFPVIETKLQQFRKENPGKKLCNLGIGDVSKPLPNVVLQALMEAVKEMGSRPIGYGPATGYDFLKQAIVETVYPSQDFSIDEIFISDGILSDAANLQELFSTEAVLGVPDPAYPAYLDANILAGRTSVPDSSGKYPNVVYFVCNEASGFKPLPPEKPCSLIYLCSPNNPTGTALTFKDLRQWISYAKKHRAIILYDAAYCSFITSSDIPTSIYEVPGAKETAIELKSFSKSAGFTGLRCSYAVVPKELKASYQSTMQPLLPLWRIRQNSKYNGTSYPVQRAALAALSVEGLKETQKQVLEYQKCSKYLIENLKKLGHYAVGGRNSPYIWWKIPDGVADWDFFDILLQKHHILGIPGSGFGVNGKGFLRLSGFTDLDTAKTAIERIAQL